MLTNVDEQQIAAAKDRSLRVIAASKSFARIVKVVDNTTVTVEIEVKPNETVEVKEVREMISATINTVSQTGEQLDILFMLLANKYQDNDITISVTDSTGSGMITVYNNTKPIQSLKI